MKRRVCSLGGTLTSFRLETTRSEVNQFDSRTSFLTKENVFLGEERNLCRDRQTDFTDWFQITVDDLLLSHDAKCLEKGMGEPTNEMNTEALIIILSDQFVEIDARERRRDRTGRERERERVSPQQFEGDAEMRSEVERFFDMNNIQRVVGIQSFEMRENLHFYETLILETFLIANDLQCHGFFLLVIETAKHQAERAFAQRLDNLEAITDVIFVSLSERSLLVVIIFQSDTSDLLCFQAEKIDSIVGEDFSAFELVQFVTVEEQDFCTPRRPTGETSIVRSQRSSRLTCWFKRETRQCRDIVQRAVEKVARRSRRWIRGRRREKDSDVARMRLKMNVRCSLLQSASGSKVRRRRLSTWFVANRSRHCHGKMRLRSDRRGCRCD